MNFKFNINTTMKKESIIKTKSHPSMIPNIDDLSFNNTKISFQAKNLGELLLAFLLFKFIDYNFIAHNIPKIILWALKYNLPIQTLLELTVFKHFCGGKNLEECTVTLQKLAKFKIKSILDYAVEHLTTDDEFDEACLKIMQTIDYAKNNPNIQFCVFKPTSIANSDILEKASSNTNLTENEKIQLKNAQRRFYNLCKRAYENDVNIFIDAEETWIQPIIDQWVEELMIEFNKKRAIVYNTLQMYRWDRLDYLKYLHQKGIDNNFFVGIKIVRGAYMEKERLRAKTLGYKDPIQPDKQSTDRDYNLAQEYCIKHLDKIALWSGTHNEESNYRLAKLINAYNIDRNDPRVAFSQLYGMSDNITYNLAYHGYNVMKYIPFGPIKAVLPYLFRRAQENTSVQGQSSRELKYLSMELQRRLFGRNLKI